MLRRKRTLGKKTRQYHISFLSHSHTHKQPPSAYVWDEEPCWWSLGNGDQTKWPICSLMACQTEETNSHRILCTPLLPDLLSLISLPPFYTNPLLQAWTLSRDLVLACDWYGMETGTIPTFHCCTCYFSNQWQHNGTLDSVSFLSEPKYDTEE